MTPGEQTQIRRALQLARDAGFLAISVFDGEEHQLGAAKTMTDDEVIASCDSVDDSRIHFAQAGVEEPKPRHWAWARVILGNAEDGSEVIADNSIVPGFAEAMDKLLED